MKHLTFISAASLLVGCAAQPQQQAAAPAPLTHTSSALAFDPPIASAEQAPDLSRDQRGQAALLGFEEPTTSVYDVFTYNRQAGNYGSYYDKEAVTERTGATHR